jgi:tetratricopeptide (TPR) repeat protein
MRLFVRTRIPVALFALSAIIGGALLFGSAGAQSTPSARGDAHPAEKTAGKKAAETPPAAPATDAAAPPTAAAGSLQEAFEKAEGLLKSGDYQAAISAYNDAGKMASKQETFDDRAQLAAIVGRARAFTGLKQYDAALNDLNNVLQLDTDNVAARVARGKVKLETNKADDALVDFEQAVKAQPSNAEAQFGYGKSLVLNRHAGDAIDPLTRAIEADPKNAEAYRLRGTAYAASSPKRALEDFKQAVAINPDDFEAYFNWGMVDGGAERHQDAIEHFAKAIEKYKPKTDADSDMPYMAGHLHHASELIELGKVTKDPAAQKALYKQASDETKALVDQLDPKNPLHFEPLAGALFSRGVSLRMLGDLAGAIRTFTQALEYYPDLTEAYFRRGICFHLIGEDKMAISDFQQAAHLGFEQRDPRANLWEGFTYAKMGDYHQALRAYGDAIAASDRYTPAFYNRALTYMMLGEYKKAIADFNAAIRLAPANAEYYFKRGLAYQQLGDNQKASESFATAITFDTQHVGAYRHMADVMQALGRNELATQYRQKADQLSPQKKSR